MREVDKHNLKMIILSILLIVSYLLISWGITCVLFWVLCKCFSGEFQLKLATGIWLLVLLARIAIKSIDGK